MSVATLEAIRVEESELTFEESEDDSPLEIAPDSRRVRTDKQDVPVDALHSRVKRGKIDLQPDFQRFFVWNHAKASRLVESLLLDIPIPVIYVSEEPDASWAVVDGQQRLTSICSFIDGQFPDGRDFALSSLQILTELNGCRYSQLEPELQDALLASVLRLIVIQRGSDPDVKFEVFERLNLGAERLNDQELRNSVYRGAYNKLLGDLTHNSVMLRIMNASQPDKRMRDRQLILRFFAMCHATHLRYRSPMKTFLNREMEEHRNPSDRELKEFRDTFVRSIEMAYCVFGDHAFRRFRPGSEQHPNGYWEQNKLNVALWDTLLYTLSYYQKPQIIPIVDSIREEFLDLMTNDQTFVEYITSTTDKPERVRYRADAWRRRLDALVGTTERGPRTFSLKLKKELYEADPTCQICGQRIHHIDSAEVDHIEHYWRGGRTIPENARLVHRYCNRARGGRE